MGLWIKACDHTFDLSVYSWSCGLLCSTFGLLRVRQVREAFGPDHWHHLYGEWLKVVTSRSPEWLARLRRTYGRDEALIDERRKTMGANARERAISEFGRERVVGRYVEVYHRLLEEPDGG